MRRRAASSLARRAAASAAMLLLVPAAPALAQVGSNCTVSVLNRTVTQNADGSWVLPNVPANFGPVRARATCIVNGQTISGESDPFTVPANGIVNLPRIRFGQITPIPTSLSLATPTTTLGSVGATAQLLVSARYSDGSTTDVTAASTFTQYTVSNVAIATVSADGLVAAVSSGTVLIQATHEGASGMLSMRVLLAGNDTDGDGIPDDYEVAHGMNPASAIDAMEDFDRDGLTNVQEYQLGTDPRRADTDNDGLKDGDEVARGTNPLLKDTDGDLIPDGLEVQTSTNPLDRNSYDLKAAAASSAVFPPSFILTTSVIFPNVSRQLIWKVTLLDGTVLDLTADPRTSYGSSNLTICNFGATPGQIFAGSAGVCVITITNNTLSVPVSGTIQSFTPTALSFVNVPGFANNVDVSGNFAYVAAGSAGLQIVNVTNHSSPAIVASRALPGNANDVVVSGSFAYVAAGTGGLQIVNISNPLAPTIAASLATGGTAWDVVVKNGRAYVANGAGGLVVIDVSNPTAPVQLGALSLAGTSKGVDVDTVRQIAAVARGTTGLSLVNVANPAAPVLLGSLAGGDVRDVAISGNFAFLADFSRSFTAVDITNPSAPLLRGSTPQSTGGLLQDVAVRDKLAVGADVFFVNGVPAIDVSTPASPQPRAIISFAGFRDDNGTGIALDALYVYLTAQAGSITENGVSGTTRLYIGQYQTNVDNSGVPPTVTVTAPLAGSSIAEGALLNVTVDAIDDVAVAAVTLLVNGFPAATSTTYPYQFPIIVPVGATSLTIGATATDFGSNTGTAPDVTLSVTRDITAPVVSITAPASGTTLMEGATFSATVQASDDVRVTRVDLLLNGTAVASRTSPPFQFTATVPLGSPTLTVGAAAVDVPGNIGLAPNVLINVIPDPPPTVSITFPIAGSTLLEGATITVLVPATDNTAVTQVDLSVNGQLFATDVTVPFQFLFTVPAGVSSLTFSASARDTLGRISTATNVVVSVAPDPLTTVQGTVVDRASAPVAGAQVSLDLNGLTAQVFNFSTFLTTLPNLTGLTPDVTTIVSTPNMPNPAGVFGDDPFGFGPTLSRAVRFTGTLRTTVAGTYTFSLGVNAGGRLIVNGTTVVNLPNSNGASQAATGTIALPIGTASIELQTFDNGAPEVVLRYMAPGGQLDGVQPGALIPAIVPYQSTSQADGTFSIPNVPTIQGNLVVNATVTVDGVLLSGASAAVPPDLGGITNAGTIVVVNATKAIVASRNSSSIHILDIPHLSIQSTLSLGSDVVDTAVTSDGTTAVVTSFSAARVTFLDLTTNSPTVTGSVGTPIAAEDIAIACAPNCFAVVADGGSASRIVSIDIAGKRIASTLALPVTAAGITVTPGGLVLVNSFSGNTIRVVSLSSAGVLSDTGVSVFGGGSGPLNVTVSPDGRIALVANVSNGVIGVLQIATDGTVSLVSTLPSFPRAQSIAFTLDGLHAYVLLSDGQVGVLNIDASNNVTDSGTRIPIAGSAPTYFGVDQIAVTSGSEVLVHLNGAVIVIDAVTNSVKGTIALPNDGTAGGIAVIR